VMLFVQEAPLTAATPPIMRADLQVFELLLGKHCAGGQFASRHKAVARMRVTGLIGLLNSLHALLARLLTPGDDGGNDGDGAGDDGDGDGTAPPPKQPSGGAAPAVDVEALSGFLTQLLAQQPAFSRDLLLRLLNKCKGVKVVHGRKGASLVDACAATAARRGSGATLPPMPSFRAENSAGGLAEGSTNSTRGRAMSAGYSDLEAEESARVCARLFEAAAEAVAMGRKGFTVVRLLETLGTTKRW
jgi:hypothetical protein